MSVNRKCCKPVKTVIVQITLLFIHFHILFQWDSLCCKKSRFFTCSIIQVLVSHWQSLKFHRKQFGGWVICKVRWVHMVVLHLCFPWHRFSWFSWSSKYNCVFSGRSFFLDDGTLSDTVVGDHHVGKLQMLKSTKQHLVCAARQRHSTFEWEELQRSGGGAIIFTPL